MYLSAPPHGSKLRKDNDDLCNELFQSTPPMREETLPFSSQPSPVYIFQPTPPAREETCGRINGGWERWAISTRSSRTGGDQAQDMQTGGADYISTHSSRTGGDPQRSGKRYQRGNFNPLLPHGRRRCARLRQTANDIFQSTPPAREETGPDLCDPRSN